MNALANSLADELLRLRDRLGRVTGALEQVSAELAHADAALAQRTAERDAAIALLADLQSRSR